MARWMGCISATKAPKGSSVMPERLVSSTTEKAPSCSVTTQPMTDAATIRSRTALAPSPNQWLCRMGRQIR